MPLQLQCRGDPHCGSGENHRQSYLSDSMQKPLDFDTDVSSQAPATFPAEDDRSKPQDLESLRSFERVTIAIRGSGCACCTHEVDKVLRSMPFVHYPRLQAVPMQADFDLDISRISVQSMMRLFQERTGCVCQRIRDSWQVLQVVATSPSMSLEDLTPPHGVVDIERQGKGLFSIKYDATKIGARQLIKDLAVEKNFHITLAPEESWNGMPVNLRKTGYLTCASWILTIPILILAWAPLKKHRLHYQIASLILATLVQALIAGRFYPKAIRSLFVNRVIDMDLLVVLSTSITYCFSVTSFILELVGSHFATETYFETSTLLISLIMLGKFVAGLSCHQVCNSSSLKSLQPQLALLVDSSVPVDNPVTSCERVNTIESRLLELGDTVEIRPGSAAPTDGIVLRGESYFDESILTGEAKVVKVSVGSSVIAGSIHGITALNVLLGVQLMAGYHSEAVKHPSHSLNLREPMLMSEIIAAICGSSPVDIQVTRLPGTNSISDIANLVEEVSRSKSPSQALADQMAYWIVPAIGGLSLLTFLVWVLIGNMVQNKSASSAVFHAIPYAVAVLVVSCPCAIGLTIPMVQSIASNVAASHGLVLRSSEVITTARKVTHVVFDKTGTLTTKNMTVVHESFGPKSSEIAPSIVLALTSHSLHPASSAVAAHLKHRSGEAVQIKDVTIINGKGIEGNLEGCKVRLGSARWLGVEHHPIVRSLLLRDLTIVCVAQDNELIAVFGLEAAVRNDAADIVARLKQRNIQVMMMSGDEIGAVQKLAAEVQIPRYWAKLMPQDKQRHVEELMRSKGNVVLFCGDGANDAAALAQASVGVHINNGSGNTNTITDATLTNASLTNILLLLDLSRDSFYQIIFGFGWSVLYNLFAITFAAGLLVKIRLPPEYAGLGEVLSVLPVVIAPLRLRWKNYR